MNCLNKRFVIEPARPSDTQEILHLLEQSPFKGRVSLLYTRRPDAYQSFLYEGQSMEISVCRDTRAGSIIGIGAYVIHTMYINAQEEQVAYIFGLKACADYLKVYPLLPKFYAYLEDNLKKQNIKFCYTTILADNIYAQKLLEKKRKIMPYYQKFGHYETFAIRNTSPKRKSSAYTFKEASEEDGPDMVRFLNEAGRKYQLFPVIQWEDIVNETFKGLRTENFYLLKDKGVIVAAGAVWDQRDYKQYIVQQYSGLLQVLHMLPLLGKLFQLPPLPDPGQALHFYTLSRWAVKDNDAIYFQHFLDGLKGHTAGYPFMIVGIHESHPLRSVLMKQKHIKYNSNVYLVDWVKDINPVQLLNAQMPSYIECGAL